MKYFMEIIDGQPVGNLLLEDSLQYLPKNKIFREVIRSEWHRVPITHINLPEPRYVLEGDYVKEVWDIALRPKEQRKSFEPQGKRPAHPEYTLYVNKILEERNKKLRDSDWTQLSDAKLSEGAIQAWTQYRQALRDLPDQPDFPWEITWPTPPTGNEPSPVPKKVGSGQIRAAMIAMDFATNDETLSTTIESILSNIPDGKQRAIAVTLWRNASEFKRDHEFIGVVQQALGKTSEEIDDLFRLAATF